jgi:hypothetical protein
VRSWVEWSARRVNGQYSLHLMGCQSVIELKLAIYLRLAE